MKIARWTPSAARQRITELLTFELSAHERDVLARLATYPALKTEVWGKLPPDPPNQESDVILYALEAAFYAADIRPAKPRTKKAIAAWHRKYPPISAEGVQDPAAGLKRMIIEYSRFDAAYWAELWPGAQGVSIDDAIKFIGHVEEYYRRLEARHRDMIRAANLPPLRKKGPKMPTKSTSAELCRNAWRAFMAAPLMQSQPR
jgi:hypothetical protein